MFNRSRPKYQNKLPVGYTPKAMNCDDYNPVVRMQESIATNLPFRGVPQGYKWYVHTQREKSIRKRIANRATPGWSAHLEGKPYQQLEYGRYGLKRIPIGLDCDVGKDREKARYYAYWHNVTHWPLSKVEEYRNRYYFDEQDYNWWLYNTRALCPSDANQLDRWLEKRAVLNPPRLKYVRIEHEPICYTRLKSIGNFLLEPFKEKEATFKNILPMPIGEVRTEYQQTFEELRKATCRPTLSLVHSEISVEAQIGNLEDHLYEDHIPEILELTQQCADDFMLHLTRTEIKLKESGNEVDYLAFKQAMPLIAEQLKQKFPIPVLDDNEQVFVDRLAKQSGLYRYC
jgi:hypothetical protein